MKEVIIGILSGCVAALGMGGGTVLILLLGIWCNIGQHIAQGTNLIFFIPTSIVAIYMNIKNKTIDYKMATKIIIPGIMGSVLSAFLSFKFENDNLKKYFGIFLLFIAALEIYSFVKQNILKKEVNNNN